MILDAAQITILLPCRAQPRPFFDDSVGSVLAQTSDNWKLLILIDHDSPAELLTWIEAFQDPRIGIVVCDGGLAHALNRGMAEARTSWLSILLADDRYTPEAIETLQQEIRRHPKADFFHSARREIDANGNKHGPIHPSRRKIEVASFVTLGSPVKHLMCWRRDLGLAIGGMDETLWIGPDDYDFPWRMLENGCRFQSVKKCLYEYRVHHVSPRITTDCPLNSQLQSLTRMFRKHGISQGQTTAFLQKATENYLIKDKLFDFEVNWRSHVHIRCHREANAEQRSAFVEKGFRSRHFFPHRVLQLPKGGVDGMKLAERMSGIHDPAALAQLLLYGLAPEIERLPEDLFFDDDVQWHRQQFGISGQIASANLAFRGDSVYTSAYHSDLVQRIARRSEHRTRVDKLFSGWPRLLLNAVMNAALDRDLRTVYSPTAALAITHTDPKRTVGDSLFVRVYDTTVREHLQAEQHKGWWRIDVAANRHRVAPLAKGITVSQREPTICLCHDIELGLGHKGIDPELAAKADRHGEAWLDQMLALEREAGITATYSILGCLWSRLEPRITTAGHATGFHSFDHQLPSRSLRQRLLKRLGRHSEQSQQLERCRQIDYRSKGYRPPQSRLTSDLTDSNLSRHGFEWLACSAWTLGIEEPKIQNGIVKIPILFDDYNLYRDGLPFHIWKEQAWQAIRRHPFVAFSLHDCYAHLWLPHYQEFLKELKSLGRLCTLNQVAAETTLAQARWI